MKRLFFVLLLLLVACGEEINTPEVSNSVTQFNSSTVNIDSVNNIISTSISGQRIILDGNTNQILFLEKNNLLAGGITAETSGGFPILKFTAYDVRFAAAYLKNTGDIISNQTVLAKQGFDVNSGKFSVNASGQITTVNGIDSKEGYVLAGGGNGYSPKRLAMWRGELYEPPQDGVSGDEYYDRNTKKILKFIQSENRWIER